MHNMFASLPDEETACPRVRRSLLRLESTVSLIQRSLSSLTFLPTEAEKQAAAIVLRNQQCVGRFFIEKERDRTLTFKKEKWK